jgi:hypothetical protein
MLDAALIGDADFLALGGRGPVPGAEALVHALGPAPRR